MFLLKRKIRQRRKLGKKGSILDLFYVIVFLTGFAITFWISYTIFDEWKTESASLLPGEDVGNLTESVNIAFLAFDWIFIVMIVLLLLSTTVLAFMIDTHPVMFFISFLLLFILIVIAGILSDVFNEFAGSGDLNAAYTVFPIMNFIFDKLPVVATIGIALVLVALFLRGQGGSQAI